MARLDRAIGINAMNRVMARSSRAMTVKGKYANPCADRYYIDGPMF